MTNHGDAATPLWLTEWAWGSGPPDQFGHNVGLTGQQTLLNNSFKLVLQQRTAWNIQRMYLVPVARSGTGVLLRAPVQHLRHRGAAEVQPDREARLQHLQGLHGRDDAARGEHHRGANRAATGDPTPTFAFASNEAGSTFACHFDANASRPAPRRSPRPRRSRTAPTPSSSRRSTPPETRALVRSRSFTVDTVPPAAPQITATTPASPANNNAPR